MLSNVLTVRSFNVRMYVLSVIISASEVLLISTSSHTHLTSAMKQLVYWILHICIKICMHFITHEVFFFFIHSRIIFFFLLSFVSHSVLNFNKKKNRNWCVCVCFDAKNRSHNKTYNNYRTIDHRFTKLKSKSTILQLIAHDLIIIFYFISHMVRTIFFWLI